MTIEIVNTDNAPAAIGAYAQGIVSGDLLFISGQLPLDPSTGTITGDAGEQTTQSLKNLFAIADAAGFGLGDVVKVTVFTTAMEDFGAINSAYAEAFGEHKPARAVVGVKELPKNAKVEIELIAHR
ncbi:hypothetical protein COO72_07235 [Bifidobacterium callitrichos]|nr:hypothetical protein COO72_07235 [Bifidobacterium callitrichos]